MHVLDWTALPAFPRELVALARPAACRITPNSVWRPRGYEAPAEARLETFGPLVMPDSRAWADLKTWWLKHHEGANTPNWDIALTCDVEGVPGLVLVEAKANVPELSDKGKGPARAGSTESFANHRQIGAAIGAARDGLSTLLPGICIDRDNCYQLSNRIAFAWKLASLGTPVVLMYLGFIGDAGIADAGEPFRDEEHWHQVFRSHLRRVCPSIHGDTRIDVGPASMWILSRSRPVIRPFPPRRPTAGRQDGS